MHCSWKSGDTQIACHGRVQGGVPLRAQVQLQLPPGDRPARKRGMSTLASDAGPQAARSRRIEAQAYLQDRVASGPGLGEGEKSGADLPKLAEVTALQGCAGDCPIEKARLSEERDFLRKYVERLLGQLRVLLQKYGELDRLKGLADPNTMVHDDGDVSGSTAAVAPWLTAPEYTNPLFQAYDLKIQDLEDAIDDSRKSMDRFASRAEALAKENSTLRQELESAAERLALQTEHGSKEPRISSDPFLSLQDDNEYMQEFNDRIEVLMSENNMLMEQVSLQDDEISAMKKELTDRDQQLQSMEHSFNEATVAVQELRDSCVRLREEKQHCEKRLQQCAASIAQLETTKESHVQRIQAIQKEKNSLESQLAEYESLLSSAKKNALRKDEQYSTRYQNVCSRLRDLSGVIEKKDKQLEDAQEKVSALQAELESVRQDCEGMLGVMSSMEKQLNQYSTREDAVAELETECKSKVEELLLQKEEIAAREALSRREIARLLERLQQQTAVHIKELEENQNALTKKHANEIKAREEEVESLSDQAAQLRANMETVSRNHKDIERRMSEIVRHSTEAAGLYERKLRQFAERASEAEEARDAALNLEQEYNQKYQVKEKELLKLRGEFREKTQELSDKISSLERELDTRRSEVREAKDEIEEKYQKIQMLNEQLSKVKTDCSTRFTSELDVLHQQNRELKLSVEKLEYKLSQAKKDAISSVESVQNERERAEVRLIAEVESLKARVQTLKDERSRSEKARNEVESRCGVLTMQIQQLTRELSDTKELVFEHEHACEDSDRKVIELSSQLTLALSKQEQLYRQERELRNTLERMTLEHARAEREAKTSRKKLEEYRVESYTYLSKRRSQPQQQYDPIERPVKMSDSRLGSPLIMSLGEKSPMASSDMAYSLPS